jgi:hypothetical protein
MKRKLIGPRLALIWMGLHFFVAAPAQAGQVVMEISVTAQAVQGGAELAVRVSNQGDDTATNLQMVALHPPGGPPSGLVESLHPGQSMELGLNVALSPGPPGRYAVPLRLDFQDLNQFPFSALAHAYFWRGQDRASPLAVQAKPLEMDFRGTLEVTLVNTEERPIDVSWQVFAPRELGVDSARRETQLAARSAQALSLEVTSLTAQLEAEYPLLIWTGYELDGHRLEKIVEARVRLVRQENFFRRTLGWWLALAVLLAAWVTWVQIRSARQK